MKSETVQHWLQTHCEHLDEVAGGVVLSQPHAGVYQAVAEWPLQSPLTSSLTSVAKEALKRAKSMVLVPAVVQKDAEHARVIATPVHAMDGAVIGAVVLAVRSQDAEVAKRLLDNLEGVCPSLAASLTVAVPGGGTIVSEKIIKIPLLSG